MQQYSVIFDFSFLFHLSRWNRNGPEYETTANTIHNVEGKLRTVRRYLADIRVVGYDLVFAEDRPPKRKNELWPSYRNNETRTDHSEEKQEVKQHLLDSGYKGRFCHSPHNEADDTLATLARLAKGSGMAMHVILVTGDRDIWQLIGDRTSVYNPIKQEIILPAEVENSFRCQPKHIPLHKSIWGDAGDCVPNVMPRMHKQMLPIVNKTDGSLAEFETLMEKEKFYLTPKCSDMYAAALPQIRINHELVKLDDKCELVWE